MKKCTIKKFFRRGVAFVLCALALTMNTFSAMAATANLNKETASESEEISDFRMTNITVQKVENSAMSKALNEAAPSMLNSSSGSYLVEFDLVPASQVPEVESNIVTVPVNNAGIALAADDDRTYLVFDSQINSIKLYSSSSDNRFAYTVSATKNDGNSVNKTITVRVYNDRNSYALLTHGLTANGVPVSQDIGINSGATWHQLKFSPDSQQILCHVKLYMRSYRK